MPFESVINSFESGELSPNVYGRTDLQQYRNGAAALTNMLVQPSGAAKKRPGTVHLDDIAAKARIISFQTSATEAYIVEITTDTMRIIDSDGAEVYTSDTADSAIADDFTATNIFTLKFVQASREMVIVDRTFAPKLLRYIPGGSPAWVLTNLAIQEPPGQLTFDVGSAGGRPGAVTFSDQRVLFGGTDDETNGMFGSAVQALYAHLDAVDGANSFGVWTTTPQTFDGVDYKRGEYINELTDTSTLTNKSTDVNFYANDQLQDDADPYVFSVLDYGFINIQWVSNSNLLQGGVILIGTTAGLYAVIGGSAGGAISAAGGIISPRRQSVAGCSSVQGIVVNNFLMFVDSSKRRIRIAQFNLQADQFETPRINDLADHLFETDIKEIHYQRAPNSILWVLLETGEVRAFSYDSTGSLGAWVPVEFGNSSTVESMAVLPGEEEDTVVFCMYNAEQTDYTIEKMASFIETDQDEMWYVDSGIRKYNATAFTSMSGLDHLEGETLRVWADGAVHKDVTVASGSVTFTREVNTAIVGRKYTATVTTLPIPDAQDKIKRVDRLFARFAGTLGAKAGTDEFEEIVPFREGDFEMGSQPALFSGLKEIPYFGRHDFNGQVTILSDTPTPFNLLSVITRLEVYG